MIAGAILARLAARGHGETARLSPAAEAALMAYEFPGNVRELENVLERAIALASGGVLEPLDLMLPQAEVDLLLEPDPETESLPVGELSSLSSTLAARFDLVDGVPSQLPAYLDHVEGEAIRAALLKTRNNRTAAALLLGITFRQLRYRMQRLGLK
jgi:two-component system response regulator PilR (NtrC family)